MNSVGLRIFDVYGVDQRHFTSNLPNSAPTFLALSHMQNEITETLLYIVNKAQ